jgi:AsmA protein
MRKIIRYLFIGLGTFVLLLVVGLVIFVAVFDANAYKEDISKLVREQTGRELQFQGDIGLTLYPALGMELGAMTFSNAAGFGELPMVRVELVSVSVDIMSLLRLAPEIDKLILRDLEINLIRNNAGVNNWDDLVKQASAASNGGDATGTAQSQQVSPKTDEFELKGAFAGLEIDNLKLLWRDEQAGEEYRVTDLDISTGRIAPNESFPLQLHLDASASGDLDIVFDLNTTVEYLIEQQQLTLSEMKLALNEFEIGGLLQVSNFAKPALRFNLASQLLDVDALLDTPPASADQPSAPAQQQAGTGSGNTGSANANEDIQIVLPMQILRDLDIDGDLAIAKLKIQNLNITDLELHLSAQNGLVALKPVRIKAYDGTVLTNLVVDVKGELPKYGISSNIEDIQVGDLLDDYMGEAPIGGNFSAGINLATSGEWLSMLKKRSNGTVNLAFLDGAVNGVNIRQSIEDAKAKFRGEDPPEKKTRKTDFSSLTISGVIKNGVFSSDDLDLQAPALRAGGEGSADLNREVVDYMLNTKLVGTSKGQQGGTADELAGISIPVRIKGPFSDPDIDVQLDEILKARIEAEKARLKAELEAEKAKLKAEADAKKAELKAEIEAQKKALEEQLEAEKRALEAEKKALEAAQKAEYEAKMELEKAKAEKKLQDKLKKLLD